MTKEFFEEHKKHGKQIEEIAVKLAELERLMEEILERMESNG